jgi:hypothetical protein
MPLAWRLQPDAAAALNDVFRLLAAVLDVEPFDTVDGRPQQEGTEEMEEEELVWEQTWHEDAL